jgi:hypothetical protein
MMQDYKQDGNSLSSFSLLTFEQVCPRWARKLKIGLEGQDVHTLAHDSKCCIVGEAWGYSGRHAGYYIAALIPFIGCWKCVKFGREMGRIANLHSRSCVCELYPIIDRFLEHWNDRHREITLKKVYLKQDHQLSEK